MSEVNDVIMKNVYGMKSHAMSDYFVNTCLILLEISLFTFYNHGTTIALIIQLLTMTDNRYCSDGECGGVGRTL